MNNSYYRLSRFDERQIHRKLVCSFDKLFGPIQRINQPKRSVGGNDAVNHFIRFL